MQTFVDIVSYFLIKKASFLIYHTLFQPMKDFSDVPFFKNSISSLLSNLTLFLMDIF